MSTAELKTSLHQLIDVTTDSSVLKAVYTLLSKAVKAEAEDWYDELSDEEKASIQRGLDDLNHGRTATHEEAMKRVNDKISRFKNA